MTVKTNDGGTIQTKDFLHNGVTIPDPVNRGKWLLAGRLGYVPGPGLKAAAYASKLFTISYNEQYQNFQVALTDKPLGKARHEAEQFLIKTLGVTPNQLCRLNYFVMTDRHVDPKLGGKDLWFSFCPDAIPL